MSLLSWQNTAKTNVTWDAPDGGTVTVANASDCLNDERLGRVTTISVTGLPSDGAGRYGPLRVSYAYAASGLKPAELSTHGGLLALLNLVAPDNTRISFGEWDPPGFPEPEEGDMATITTGLPAVRDGLLRHIAWSTGGVYADSHHKLHFFVPFPAATISLGLLWHGSLANGRHFVMAPVEDGVADAGRRVESEAGDVRALYRPSPRQFGLQLEQWPEDVGVGSPALISILERVGRTQPVVFAPDASLVGGQHLVSKSHRQVYGYLTQDSQLRHMGANRFAVHQTLRESL